MVFKLVFHFLTFNVQNDVCTAFKGWIIRTAKTEKPKDSSGMDFQQSREHLVILHMQPSFKYPLFFSDFDH